MTKLPDFIQKHIDTINKYKNNELPDIWSLVPKRLFPGSPELQKYFVEDREKQKYNL